MLRKKIKLVDYVKWVATIIQLIGYGLTGLNMTPYNVYLFFLGIFLWFAVGVMWKDKAIIVVHVGAFISLLVDRTYTATQYALLASIGTAGRTTLASSSGALVDWLNGDWGTFFILTTIMVIPSLTCLWLIRKKIKIGVT